MYLVAIVWSLFSFAKAQTYTVEDLEAQFLQNNYLLIAARFNIDKAEAQIVQEKLWPNPTLSVGEINLWTNKGSEQMSNIFGNWGKTQQIAVELEQMIETAGKRKKRVAIKGLEKNAALFDFEELMRELKKELRQTINNLYKIKESEAQLENMVQLYGQLHEQYERQSQLQNVSRADFFRVRTELTGLQLEQVNLVNEKADALHKLKVLTQLRELELEQISFLQNAPELSQKLPLDMMDIAKDQNIGLKRQENELNIARKYLELEKAQRRPDMYVNVNYDRGGNIMNNFTGLGFSMDLPVWNRNKGNIKAAQLTIEQEKTEISALQWELENEVQKMTRQIQQFEQVLQKWPSEQMEEQAKMIENYRKHLQNKQVTLMEFIDFTQSYRQTQEAYLEVLENYKNTYEELQYVVGKDF